MSRLIAIGDIHGCSVALDALMQAISIRPSDTLVTLGDYVDRGFDSCGVLERMIRLQAQCHLVPILGNHDQMMLDARSDREALRFWLECGGETALSSYPLSSTGPLATIPESHFDFLAGCKAYWETSDYIFTHANFNPDVDLEQMRAETLRWLSLRDFVPVKKHRSGKIFVVGHTPQSEVLDLGYLIGLDTHCCDGGWLTAMNMDTRQCWQSNELGAIRER